MKTMTQRALDRKRDEELLSKALVALDKGHSGDIAAATGVATVVIARALMDLADQYASERAMRAEEASDRG